MDRKHTPGPWHLDPSASFTEYTGPRDEIRQGRLAMSILAPGSTRPLMRVGGATDDPAEVAANARLVFAAHDMLEALHEAEHALVCAYGEGVGTSLAGIRGAAVIKAVRAAISKATGGGQ